MPVVFDMHTPPDSPAPRSAFSGRLTRRRVVGGLAALGALATTGALAPRALAASIAGGPAADEPMRPRPLAAPAGGPRHLVWAWQFRHDGAPEAIRDALAEHGLGIVMKTHDATSWMSRFDPHRRAVSGPEAVERLARFFEDAGVPFHAWALVKGRNPKREAEMAAEVLDAGARSFFVDLEAHPGFWEGTRSDAETYGEELRRRQPDARVSTSIDARPWEIDRIPLAEFAAFTDEISPQWYWGAFANTANARRYAAGGDTVTASGITPGFVVATSMARLRTFGLPIHPIGDGTVADVKRWSEFIDESYSNAEAETLSVWRFGVTSPDVLALLRDTPPRVAAYVVASGDTLSGIAARFGTSVDALVQTNGIANPNMIGIGTRLILPHGATVPAGAAVTGAPAGSGTVHVVQAGETLLGIAIRYGRTQAALERANGITNPHLIRIGQEIRIP
jgi:LysM repeat protein